MLSQNMNVATGARVVGLHAIPWIVSMKKLKPYKARFDESPTDVGDWARDSLCKSAGLVGQI